MIYYEYEKNYKLFMSLYYKFSLFCNTFLRQEKKK